MYESHFGLSAPPFQLSPDPSFYFDSKGHSNALAYLRFGAYQGEGFIVVTGEIGAGKTTLVRALLSELNTDKVVAAQVVSTQLEAGDLLRSILTAFGVSSAGLTKAQLIASLEAFLTLLATRGQRALLIIDEAQNLNLEAVEEMRMLSNFQFDQHALLQSFLVGQPELRRLLQSKSMEQLRQRVIASCHLGPLDLQETRAYVEHRLRKVGWQDRPHFEPEAFDVIHAATGGIPRRINVLCNRVMLAAFLSENDRITDESVKGVADDLRAEVGEQASVGQATRAPVAAPSAVKALPSAAEVMKLHRTPGAKPEHPVLLVADAPIDYLKLRALAARLEANGSACAPVVVSSRSLRDVRSDEAAADALPAPVLEICLNAGTNMGAEMVAQVLLRFDAQLVDLAPAAVAVIGDGDAVLACALAANLRGIPLLRLDGGLRDAPAMSPGSANAALVDRLASAVFTRSVNSHYTLYREGISAERVQCVGSLFGAVLESTRAAVPEAAEVLRRFGLAPAALDTARPFALLCLTASAEASLAGRLDALFAQIKGSIPMLWVADRSTADAIRTAALESRLERQRVTLLPALGLLDGLALMSCASLVIGDARARWIEEAACLGVPYLELADDGANAAPLARAVDEILGADPVAGEPAADSRATDAVLHWLASLGAQPAHDTLAAQEPGRKR